MQTTNVYVLQVSFGHEAWSEVWSPQRGTSYYRNLVDAEKFLERLSRNNNGLNYRIAEKHVTLPLVSVNNSPRLV